MTHYTINNMAQSPIPHPVNVTSNYAQTETALFDFTMLDRSGLRGEDALKQIESSGLPIPEKVNQVVDTEKNTVLRLSQKECWVLASSDQNLIPELVITDKCYKVPCLDSHAWIVMKSPFKAEIMAKVCGVDLRVSAFELGQIAQTSVAGCSTIVAHHQIGGEDVFSLLCDRSVAHYLWEVLVDAMHEFDGQISNPSAFHG